MRNVKHTMKHLMRYEGYTSYERADDILDKISESGMQSLTAKELKFLEKMSRG